MHEYFLAELRLQDDAARAARLNTEGWRAPLPARGSRRAALAAALLALAARLAPAAADPVGTPPLTTTPI